MALYSAHDNGDGSITLSSGQVVFSFHQDLDCSGRVCPVHNPSDHEFRNLPLGFVDGHMVRYAADNTILIDPDDYQLNRYGTAILRNSAKCLKCGDEVFSRSRHDFVTCSCGNVSVDGGLAYVRHLFRERDLYLNTSEQIYKDKG